MSVILGKIGLVYCLDTLSRVIEGVDRAEKGYTLLNKGRQRIAELCGWTDGVDDDEDKKAVWQKSRKRVSSEEVCLAFGITKAEAKSYFSGPRGFIKDDAIVNILKILGIIKGNEFFTDSLILNEELKEEFGYNLRVILVFTNRNVILVWDEPGDRNARVDRWRKSLDSFIHDGITVNNKKKLIHFGPGYRNWCFSDVLWGDGDELKQAILDKATSSQRKKPVAKRSDHSTESDLGRVTQAWPNLPNVIKVAILALVETDYSKTDSTSKRGHSPKRKRRQ